MHLTLFCYFRAIEFNKRKLNLKKKWGVLEESGGNLYNFVPTTIN